MQLGIDRLDISLHSREQVRDIVQAFAEQAQRTLSLLTMDMEPAIFDKSAFLDAITRLSRQSRDASFRILLLDSRRVAQQGHRLIELSRRLGSTIQFRCPPSDYQHTGLTFLTCDDTGYFCRPLSSRYEGNANFNSPGEVARLNKSFKELWDRSEPDSELRMLQV
jgi:hypothetical protein